LGTIIAKLSQEPNLQIDGIFLDTDLYGTSKRGLKGYSKDTCFCDNYFSSFLLSKGYKGEDLPVLNCGQRSLLPKKLI